MNTLNRLAALMLLLLPFTGLYAQQDALFIDPWGKVGLGTTSPQYKLHVSNPDANNSLFAVANKDAFLSAFCHATDNISLALGSDYSNGKWQYRSSPSVGWLYKLGNSLQMMWSGEVSSGSNIQPQSGIVLDLTNGNVGIGTTNLNEKLTVQGNVGVQGNIKATGTVSDGKGEIMPKGAIILWSGNANNIPPGWALCDGRNNTPNLVDRFVLGAGTGNAGGTGGNKEVKLNANQIPPHRHKLQGVGGQGTDSKGEAHQHVHIHDPNVYKTTTEAESSGSGTPSAAVNIMPPYYALCYIMKL